MNWHNCIYRRPVINKLTVFSVTILILVAVAVKYHAFVYYYWQ